MQLTKTQLFEEIRNQGLDEETITNLMSDFADLPEELSQTDLERVDSVLAEVQGAHGFAALTHGEMADALENASDKILDAADEYIEDSARVTVNNVQLAQSMLE